MFMIINTSAALKVFEPVLINHHRWPLSASVAAFGPMVVCKNALHKDLLTFKAFLGVK